MDNKTPFDANEHRLEHQREHHRALEQVERKNVFTGLLAGLTAATVFGLGGYFLLRDNTGAIGGVVFLLLPIASGFAAALVTRRRSLIYASLLIAAIICLTILLITGVEGLVCVLMA